MEFFEALEIIGLAMLKMAVIWGSMGIGLIVLAAIIKMFAAKEVELLLRKIFNTL